ncbi:hypothetical protein FA13DRAFT_1091822 [Coprinellus micaceus]|uniref:Uncharacterized protein n=1 Tax=Coprinellus micaceus TaxID=71717 RepID=A0A4Y7TS21_COPMI|nr:hypothetical protein FA13DRAFT_1091822 [Coprinellus micaceus]
MPHPLLNPDVDDPEARITNTRKNPRPRTPHCPLFLEREASKPARPPHRVPPDVKGTCLVFMQLSKPCPCFSGPQILGSNKRYSGSERERGRKDGSGDGGRGSAKPKVVSPRNRGTPNAFLSLRCVSRIPWVGFRAALPIADDSLSLAYSSLG